jgi:hypothetical protein
VWGVFEGSDRGENFGIEELSEPSAFTHRCGLNYKERVMEGETRLRESVRTD